MIALRALFALSLLIVFAQPAGAAETLQLFLGHPNQHQPDHDPVAATAERFRAELKRLSGGRIKVEILPDGALGGNREMVGLVDKGVIHAALSTIGGVAPVHPPSSVLYLPFAFDTVAQARRVLDGPFGQALAADMAASTRLRLLGFVDPGGFHILTNLDRDIQTPDDMWGLNIRAIPGFRPLEAMIRATGARPMRVSSREEMIALSTGAIDGQMNPATVVVGRGFDTVQGYATLTNHLYAPLAFLFHGPTLESLPPEEARLIRQAAQSAIAHGRVVGDRLEKSERGVAGLRKRLVVRALTPAERAAFKDAMRPPAEEAIAETLGEKAGHWLDDLTQAVKKAR